MRSMLTEEMETTVNMYKNDKFATVYSSDPTYIKRLDKLAAKFPDEYKCIQKNAYSSTYTFPKKRFHFARPKALKKDVQEGADVLEFETGGTEPET